MAIFHYSNNVITRSKKGEAAKLAGARGSTKGDQRVAVMSVVAAAAYRAGEDLTLTWEKNPFARYLLAVDPEIAFEGLEGDKSVEIMTQTSTQFDYSRKRDIAYKEILAPEGSPSSIGPKASRAFPAIEAFLNKIEQSGAPIGSNSFEYIRNEIKIIVPILKGERPDPVCHPDNL